MQFKHNIYLWTFCLDDLFVVKSEALLVLILLVLHAIMALFFISPLRFVNICFIYLVVPMNVRCINIHNCYVLLIN